MSLLSHPPPSTIASLPLSDPRCNNDSCVAFYTAHNASQAEVSYAYQYYYGHFCTYYYLAIIVVFMVIYCYLLLHDSRLRRNKGPASSKPDITDKSWAVVRSVTYRRFKGPLSDRFGLPSFGILLLLFSTILFVVVATFAITPYYRLHRGFGSPPLAVRTGLMATACTPILVALAGKANIITYLTGIGHEQLNVIHRWVGWIVLALSIVHTVPFLVAPLNDGGYAALKAQFYKPGAYEVCISIK